MKTSDIIKIATKHLEGLAGHAFDVLELAKPVSPNAAVNLSKIVSKLSPLVGNLIEFNTVEYLNGKDSFKKMGSWKRQDPGFPDAVFEGIVKPTPGFEIKAWFPLATEITARFKDSQNHFVGDNTHVALLAWLPEYLIYGKPKIVAIAVTSGFSVARARDTHYNNPPDYLVLEPGDTTTRTSNLQQTNTSGYIFQGTEAQRKAAQRIVDGWGASGSEYQPTPAYQTRLISLLAKFPYRLDTNFAKIDRIEHPDIEAFKTRVYNTQIHGRTIKAWNKLLSAGTETAIATALAQAFNITHDEKSVVE